MGGGLGLGLGVVVVWVVVDRVVVVGVVLLDGTDCVGAVGVVPPDDDVVVVAHPTPAPKRSAHAATATVRASATTS